MAKVLGILTGAVLLSAGAGAGVVVEGGCEVGLGESAVDRGMAQCSTAERT